MFNCCQSAISGELLHSSVVCSVSSRFTNDHSAACRRQEVTEESAEGALSGASSGAEAATAGASEAAEEATGEDTASERWTRGQIRSNSQHSLAPELETQAAHVNEAHVSSVE